LENFVSFCSFLQRHNSFMMGLNSNSKRRQSIHSSGNGKTSSDGEKSAGQQNISGIHVITLSKQNKFPSIETVDDVQGRNSDEMNPGVLVNTPIGSSNVQSFK